MHRQGNMCPPEAADSRLPGCRRPGPAAGWPSCGAGRPPGRAAQRAARPAGPPPRPRRAPARAPHRSSAAAPARLWYSAHQHCAKSRHVHATGSKPPACSHEAGCILRCAFMLWSSTCMQLCRWRGCAACSTQISAVPARCRPTAGSARCTGSQAAMAQARPPCRCCRPAPVLLRQCPAQHWPLLRDVPAALPCRSLVIL
jgi:hypothetical protein